MRVARRAGSAHAAIATAASSAVDRDRAPPDRSALTPNSWLSRLLRSAQRAGGAEHEAAADQQQPFAQHQLEDRRRAAAERDADADLLAPLRHQVGEHAVDADRREEQRDRAEAERQQHRRAPASPATRSIRSSIVWMSKTGSSRSICDTRRARASASASGSPAVLDGEGQHARRVLRHREVVRADRTGRPRSDRRSLMSCIDADDGEEHGLVGDREQVVDVRSACTCGGRSDPGPARSAARASRRTMIGAWPVGAVALVEEPSARAASTPIASK